MPGYLEQSSFGGKSVDTSVIFGSCEEHDDFQLVLEIDGQQEKC